MLGYQNVLAHISEDSEEKQFEVLEETKKNSYLF